MLEQLAKNNPFIVSKKLLFFVLLGVITSLMLNVLFFSHSSLAANMELTPQTDKKIQQLLLNRAIAYCLSSSSLSGGAGVFGAAGFTDYGKRITGNDTANSGEWFMSSGVDGMTVANTGPYMKDTQFKINEQSVDTRCGSKEMVKLYLDNLGVKGLDVLCKSNFERSVDSGSNPCLQGNGDLRRKNDDRSKSSEKFRESYPDPSLDDEGWYWFYRKTFNWSCGYGKMTTPVSESIAKDSKDYGYSLTYVTTEKPWTKTNHFIGYEKRSTEVKTRLGPSLNPVVMTCAEIEAKVNEYGNKFASYVSLLDPSEIEKDQADVIVGPSDAEGKTTCAVESVGWIVCPVVNFASTMSDALYGWISTQLQVQPLNIDTASDQNTTYKAWEVMRNIANVAFVIAFLIIIFSQLTSTSVSNYGVKKMLPRLIIAAILVNLSYWIAAIAVDLSNIIGNNIYNVLRNVSVGEVTDSLGWGSITSWVLSGGAIVGAVAGISLGVTAIGSLALYVLIPVILGVGIALILAFVILALRQALIIIMIIVAPLAFVAFLLPNTERFFKMWQKSFTTLLIFYPLFSLIFGGAYVAGMVIIGTASNGGTVNEVTILVGMAVTTIPLFLTPLLIKFSSGIMGQAASALNGKLKSNPLSRMAKGLRNRKAGLAMGERFGRDSKNPFNKAYRAIQNNRQADKVREENIGKSNKAAYLDTNRAGRLDAQGRELGERIEASEAHHKAAHERNVTNSAGTRGTAKNPSLMELRQRQDASARVTADEKAKQAEYIQNNLSQASLDHDFSKTNAEGATQVAKDAQLRDIKRRQDADPNLRNIALRQAAVTGELNQIDKDRQRIISQAGNAEGAADLAAQGYDAAAIGTIQDTNNSIADTDLHIAHNDALNTAETAIRQGADDNLSRVKLATEGAKQVKAGEDKEFEGLVGATKTAEGRAILESEGLISSATAASFATTQRGIAGADISIARSNAEGIAEIAEEQSTDIDIMNDKLATEAAQQAKLATDKDFEDIVASAKTGNGAEILSAQGYDTNAIESLQGSQASIADTEIDIARSNADANLETAARQEDDVNIQNTKLATEAANREKKGVDERFGQVLAEAGSTQGIDKLMTDNPGYNRDSLERLQSARTDANVVASATAAADRVERQEYTDLLQSESLEGQAARAESAGIDTAHGEALAVAQAIETQRQAREKNVSAYSVRMRDAGTNTTQLADIAQNVRRDTSGNVVVGEDYAPEEQEAAVRMMVDSGNIDVIKPYINYLATAASQPGITPEQLDTISDLQKAFGERIASSPGKPVGVGAGDIDALRAGTLGVPTIDTRATIPFGPSIPLQPIEIQTLNTVIEKGISADGWASMDKNDINTISMLIQRGYIPQDRLNTIQQSLETSLTDVRIKPRIKERENNLLRGLYVGSGGEKSDLQPIPPTTPPTT